MDRLLEYETDAYANLGLCYLLHKASARPTSIALSDRELNRRLADRHVSEESQLTYLRTPELFASFTWKRLEGLVPSALFIPMGCDDMAEWGPSNLVGRIAVANVTYKGARLSRSDKLTPEGFECVGSVEYVKTDGTPAYTLTVRYTVDGVRRLAEVRSRFVADADLEARAVEGLRLHVASDRFNAGRRRWTWEGGQRDTRFDLKGPWPDRETVRTILFTGKWVNIDGRITITDLSPNPAGFALRTSDRRNSPWGSIHYDVLDAPIASDRPSSYAKGQVILETAFRMEAVQSRAETR
jgi:hypothetical protein